MRRWKIGGKIDLGRALARLLARTIVHRIGHIDGIVPIPGRRLAAARRGFDTGYLLAEVLHEELHTTGPVMGQLVQRQTVWHWGGAASRRRARSAVRPALYGRGAAAIPRGARLLLVDDIMTSQASARRCSDLLMAGGAKRVEVAVVGRTTSPTGSPETRE